jgi:hypothetical protein
MTSIASSLLSGVVGGVGLQPGATEGTPDPIVHRHAARFGLRPGAVASSPNPIVRVVPHPLGLQPGATD